MWDLKKKIDSDYYVSLEVSSSFPSHFEYRIEWIEN